MRRSSIISFLNRLADIGIKPQYNEVLRNQIRLCNNFFIYTTPIYILYMILNVLINFELSLFMAYTVMFCIGVITLLINHMGMHTLAKIYVMSYSLIILNVLLFLFGTKVNFEVFLVLISIISIYLFERKRISFIVIAVYSFTFAVSSYYVILYGAPFEHKILAFTPFFILFFGLILIFAFSFARIQESRKSLKEKENLLIRLSAKNKILIDNQKLIETQNISLEQKNASLNKFLHIASHDLKTPLRSIKSFVGLAKRKLATNQAEQAEEYLEIVSKSASHMNQLINDLLKLSSLDGKEIEKENTNLNDVFNNVKAMLSQTFETKISIESNILPSCDVHSTLFILLFQNIIENGLKYNNSDLKTIKVNYKPNDNSHCIEFIDNGIGIDKKYAAKVFNIFERLHSSVEYEGTGLGLSICKKIMEQHNGSIEIYPNSNQRGSCFLIKWPKEKASSQNKTKEAKSIQLVPVHKNKAQIGYIPIR